MTQSNDDRPRDWASFRSHIPTADAGSVCDECGSPHVSAVCSCGLCLCPKHQECPDCGTGDHLCVLILDNEEYDDSFSEDDR